MLRFNHSVYRLVIRNIQGYGTFPTPIHGVKRQPNISPELEVLKQKILDLLIKKEGARSAKLHSWSIAWQTHPSSGLPHLDILLVYEKNYLPILTSFDYLIKNLNIKQRAVDDNIAVGHVWITPYSSKKLNKAVLDYGQKEDPRPLSNISLKTKDDLTRLSKLKSDPYRHLELEMLKDPINFSLQNYVRSNDLAQHISSWSAIKTKLKDMQVAAANLSLRNRPGFRLITSALIQSSLTSAELTTFKSWTGYQTIVDHLNQMNTEKGFRQQKTKNLLITGPPNTGKSALVWQRNPLPNRSSIVTHCSVYPMGMKDWFPEYRSDVYACIYWNQAKLTSYSYSTILQLLDGSPVMLPSKGGGHKKVDNPLIIMTSNLTLNQMIEQKFHYNKDYMKMARQNLSVRIQNVVIPKNFDLFLLQKLIHPNY